MRRRESGAGLGGAAAVRPLGVRAQQGEQVRGIGLLAGGAESDRIIRARIVAFREGLATLGWVEARNLLIDLRFGGGGADHGKFR
jgi:putative tryptophan/tyrosine transport system substrate-binding protein